MPTKRIILFPQDKGGIGKSFVATLLHDYLTDVGVRLKAFDLDHANSTFNRLVPEAEFIDTDVDTDKLGVLDRIVLSLPEADVVLVDNRATGGSKVLAYLDETQLPEMQDKFGCMLVFVVIATDDKDANSQIAELLDSTAPACAGWSPATCAMVETSIFLPRAMLGNGWRTAVPWRSMCRASQRSRRTVCSRRILRLAGGANPMPCICSIARAASGSTLG